MGINMIEKKFLKSEAIKTGWNKTGSNIVFFIALLLVAGLVTVVPEVVIWGLKFYSNIIIPVLSSTFGNANLHLYIEPYIPVAILVFTIASAVFGIIIQIGFISIAIKINDDAKCKIRDLFTNFRLFFKFLIGSILYGFTAFAALIFPAIFVVLLKSQLQQYSIFVVLVFVVILLFTICFVAVLAIRLGFFGYFIVDKGSSPIVAIKSSAKLTKGSTKDLLLLSFFTQGINVIGAAFFLVGLFITIPIGLIAKAFVFRKLSLRLDEEELDVLISDVSQEETQDELLADEASQIDHELPVAGAPVEPDVQDLIFADVNSILNYEQAHELPNQLEKDESKQPANDIKKKSNISRRLNGISDKLSSFKLSRNENKEKKMSFITKVLAKYNFSVELIISSMCIIISIVFFFLFLQPLKSQNITLENDLNNKVEALNRLHRKGKNIYNEKWIKAKEEDINYFNDELSASKEFLKERDIMIERVFVDINDLEVKDEALWKRHYRERSNYLQELLASNDVSINEKNFNLKTWDLRLPTTDEISAEQKRFWIQNEVVNIIIKNNHAISEFYYLNFKDKPLVENKSTAKLFSAIPISLKLEIENTMVLYVISDILGSDLNFFIESVKLEQNEDENRRLVENTKPYILTLEAYVMDFNNAI